MIDFANAFSPVTNKKFSNVKDSHRNSSGLVTYYIGEQSHYVISKNVAFSSLQLYNNCPFGTANPLYLGIFEAIRWPTTKHMTWWNFYLISNIEKYYLLSSNFVELARRVRKECVKAQK